MSIEWNNLRTLNGSKQTAFEELCCQLARLEGMPKGAKFFRLGAPDAGVECYWKLPDGNEIGYQAKFFTSPPNDSQWKQVDKSVETALEKRPKLTNYHVCFPLDRPDPRIQGQKWFMDEWNDRVEKWQELARKKGMNVDFDYWGESEIWDRLSRSENRGRYYFWFNAELFDQRWFEKQIKPKIKDVGERYTPKLNFDLSIAKHFDGLGQTAEFFLRIENIYRQIEDSVKNSATSASKELLPNEYNSLAVIKNKIKNLILNKSQEFPFKIDVYKIVDFCSKGVTIAREIYNRLRMKDDDIKRTKLAERKIKLKSSESYYHTEKFGNERHYIWEVENYLTELKRFVDSSECKLVNMPVLLMTGMAGSGKTHLFCDIAEKRLQNNLPTILLLGQHFINDEPFSQILRQLGLTCSRDEFLGALEASAQANKSKALIMIDALNESDNKAVWKNYLAGLIETLSAYKAISLAVSVRSTYKETVIPDSLNSETIIEVEHQGFGENVDEATDFFFKEYEIKAPSVPILNPEFQNPLFLKTFCTAIKNSDLTEVPKGINGLTSVFDFYLESINKKLSQKLGFDPKDQKIQLAIDKLTDALIEINQMYLPRQDAKNIVGQINDADHYENTLFYHLVAEGILSADVRYNLTEDNRDIDVIRFTYERFTENLIVTRLLDNFLDCQNPQTSFLPETRLGNLLLNEYEAYQNKGKLEALSVQLPETIEKELFEVAPHCATWDVIKDVFIQSLLWREPTKIFESSRRFVNEQIFSGKEFDYKFWDAIITISSNPEHLWNAYFLHDYLSKFTMAERDAWWSVFLHNQYTEEENSSIKRLIDWAWSDYDKSHIDNESALLCGITLAWFLTSSNRFLRDRATKALVALLSNRINVLNVLLAKFIDVNDLYVLERLFAVAYGCAMRSDDNQSITKLAQFVYNRIFKKGHPIPHLLLRDYACGIIELALSRKLKIKCTLKKIRPPFKSSISYDLPTEEEIKERYEENEKIGESHIYFSVMSDFSNFSKDEIAYVFSMWRNLRLDEPLPNSVIAKEFEEGLTAKQRELYEQYKKIKNNIKLYKESTEEQRLQLFKRLLTDKEIEEARNEYEQKVINILPIKKRNVFMQTVIPFLENSQENDDSFQFDVSFAKRWIFQRVFELGWKSGYFGKFDHDLHREFVRYSKNKVERIGKKYQWLAFFELLARVSDNFQYIGSRWSSRTHDFLGAWEGHFRDIDPSNLVKKTESIFNLNTHHSWWFPLKYDYKNSEQTVEKWLRISDDLPEVAPLIQVTNPKDDSVWLNLNCHFEWREDNKKEYEESASRQIRLWYEIQSFFVKKKDFSKIMLWAKQNRFPPIETEPRPDIKIFLAEFYWSPVYSHSHEHLKQNGEIDDNNDVPVKIIPTTTKYSLVGKEHDCSITSDDKYDFEVYLPSKFIIDKLDLNWTGREGCFFDENGELVVFDPSLREKGAQALLIRKDSLLSFLRENDLEIIWTIYGQKMSYDEKVFLDFRPLIIRGIYYLETNSIKGKLSTSIESD